MKNTQTMSQKDKAPPLSQDDLMENLTTKDIQELARWVKEDLPQLREAQAKKG